VYLQPFRARVRKGPSKGRVGRRRSIGDRICLDPANARGNRSHQYFFVNGRFVRSKTLQAALEQAYRNSLFTGRYPTCILYVRLSPSDVDVNVHPTKTEVKFVRESQVFSAVYYAALSALEGDAPTPEISLTGATRNKLSESVRPEQAGVPPRGNLYSRILKTKATGRRTKTGISGRLCQPRPVRA
jgi:DNA mismatch repair ATPase MutL